MCSIVSDYVYTLLSRRIMVPHSACLASLWGLSVVLYKEPRMRAGCRRHTCSVKGFRGLGVERMVTRDIVTSVSCCCRACKGQRQFRVVEKLTPHMLREG